MKEEIILCPECKNDKFNLKTYEHTGLLSLTVICVNCGYECTHGAGVTVRFMIDVLRENIK